MMLLLVCLNVDVYVSVCVCVQCFKNAFNVLNLRISLQYLSSIYVKRVVVYMYVYKDIQNLQNPYH